MTLSEQLSARPRPFVLYVSVAQGSDSLYYATAHVVKDVDGYPVLSTSAPEKTTLINTEELYDTWLATVLA